MTKATYKYRYFDNKGNELEKRSNFSALKLTLLKTLCRLDRDGVRATAYDMRLSERYYDVVTIARYIHGDAVFDGGKLKESTRASLNRSLKALYYDGFVAYTGNRYGSMRNMREHQRNHWRITSEGKKVVAANYNGYLKSWLARNRYVGRSGAYPVSEVVRVPNE